MSNDEMKPEYDFSNAEQGKFFIPREKISLPFYFNADLEQRLIAQATRIGKSPAELVTTIIDNELRLIESLH